MPWMCLERCHDNITDVMNQLELHAQLGDISAVSPEAYNVGANGDFVWNNFTDINPIAKQYNLKIYPMITSANIINMRRLFSDPASFVANAVDTADDLGYDGYNIDFEPESGTEPNDSVLYSHFLIYFATNLHQRSKVLTVDIASWDSNLWNFTSLALTNVDKFLTMDTYTSNWSTWQMRLWQQIEIFGINRLGVGLESVSPNGTSWNEQQLMERFDILHKINVLEIDIWDLPISDLMWSFIHNLD